jgi:lactose/L-arabinose transport system substrate-binding protein
VAIDLLKTVFTDTEYYKEIMLDYACVSGYKPALSGEAFETEDEYFSNQKIYALFADTLDKVPGVNYGGYVAEANDAVTTGLSAYMSGSATIEEGLAAADEQLKNQLGK